MKFLITGSTGYIGSHLLNSLSKTNHQITAVLHKQSPTIQSDNITYIKGDLTSHAFINTLPSDVDVVIHCAALLRDYGPKKDFVSVNYQATKHLAEYYQKQSIQKFIFLSHISYEKSARFYYYAQTKKAAESFLFSQHQLNEFPITIIRPGNVYGPNASIWVNKIIKAIKRNRIALIDEGKGIFYHTYIDHVVSAIKLAVEKDEAIGKSFDITDDDYTISWKDYFSDLANIIDASPPKRNLPKQAALVLSYLMLFRYQLTHKKPWITPAIVHSLTAQKQIFINQSKDLLGYQPQVTYSTALNNIKSWWENIKE